MKNNINQIIDSLLNYLLNTAVMTQHFFYGNDKNLEILKAKIIEYDNNAVIYREDDALLLYLSITADEKTFLKLTDNFQNLAISCQVNYDGFQIALDNCKPDTPKPNAFEKYFKAKSYVKFQLSNNKYAYFLFLGGSSSGGYLFELLSLADDGSASIEKLDETPRIFRQPIQGIFDPQYCHYVGNTNKNCLPTKFSFHLLEGNDSPEKVDALYKRYNICESDRDSWLRVMEKMLQTGDKTLACKSTIKYEVMIDKKGKAQWSSILPRIANDGLPMPFGCFLNYDKLNAIFVDNINELDLIDKVYRDS